MTHIRICSICANKDDHQLQALINRYQAEGLATVEYVECLEICEPEPVISIDEIIIAPATADKVKHVVEIPPDA